jgi:hypothetical protein
MSTNATCVEIIYAYNVTFYGNGYDITGTGSNPLLNFGIDGMQPKKTKKNNICLFVKFFSTVQSAANISFLGLKMVNSGIQLSISASSVTISGSFFQGSYYAIYTLSQNENCSLSVLTCVFHNCFAAVINENVVPLLSTSTLDSNVLYNSSLVVLADKAFVTSNQV